MFVRLWMLTFYINRAGRTCRPHAGWKLEKAKDDLRKDFSR